MCTTTGITYLFSLRHTWFQRSFAYKKKGYRHSDVSLADLETDRKHPSHNVCTTARLFMTDVDVWSWQWIPWTWSFSTEKGTSSSSPRVTIPLKYCKSILGGSKRKGSRHYYFHKPVETTGNSQSTHTRHHSRKGHGSQYTISLHSLHTGCQYF